MPLRRAFLLAALVLTTACDPGDAGPSDLAADDGVEVRVIRVVDGDSVIVEAGGEEIEVRLSGVNAPERDECHHQDSTALLSILLRAETVSVSPQGLDQFGRTVVSVFADGDDVALALVAAGAGVAAEAGERFLHAESVAYQDRLGMWSESACGTGPIPEIEFVPGLSITDPPGPDGDRLDEETVVIVNRGDEPVDLGGWVVRDGSSRHRFVFPRGAQAPPGEPVEIASSAPGWDPGESPVWGNDGDIAILTEPAGRVVARWRY